MEISGELRSTLEEGMRQHVQNEGGYTVNDQHYPVKEVHAARVDGILGLPDQEKPPEDPFILSLSGMYNYEREINGRTERMSVPFTANAVEVTFLPKDRQYALTRVGEVEFGRPQ